MTQQQPNNNNTTNQQTTTNQQITTNQTSIEPTIEPAIDTQLITKLERFKALKPQGIHFNDNLIQSKAYRNPNIYTKLVEFLNINEHQTNFHLQYWAPLEFPIQSYCHSIREQQKLRSEEKQSTQSEGKRNTIEFETSRSNDHHHHHYSLKRNVSPRRR